MSAETIWARLREAGMTEAGAAGLMGNMMAESAMRADNAQDGMTSLSDEDYTAAVDNGIWEFTRDAVGYGLCQWTFHTRKAALLAYAQDCGVSIADEDMQTRFAVKELKSDNAALWAYLCSTDDWYTAASRICTEFERPAVNNIAARAEAARGFYERFCGTEVSLPQPAGEDAGGTPHQSASLTASPEGEASTARWSADMATLCEGFGGSQVRVLRFLLWAHDVYAAAEGEFDAELDSAVREFQSENGLDVDGIVGRQTWAALLEG